jgi:hypothetical protein
MPKNRTATVTILLLAMLLTNVTSFGVIKCQTNLENQVSGVIINEFMADNGITISGPEGNSPDWIELYNAGTETVDLTGMYLTDDLSKPTRWQFPDGASIKAGEYILIWADSNSDEGYATFSLNANGEEIGLFASDGTTLIDSIVYTKQLQDVSYGRDPNDNTIWDYLPTATPGSANREAVGGETSVWSLLIITALFAVITIALIVIEKLKTKRK